MLMRMIAVILYLAFHSIGLSVGAVELGYLLVCSQLEMQSKHLVYSCEVMDMI